MGVIVKKKVTKKSKNNRDFELKPIYESVFEYSSYTEYVNDRIQAAKIEQGRGVTKELAAEVQCHTTFISQVINKKAGFSIEQAIRFARFFKLDSSEMDYFVDLVGLERAADEKSKFFFKERLRRQNEKRADLKSRWSSRNENLRENELLYFGSWAIQVVHASLQMKSCRTAEAISRYLGLSLGEVQNVLKTLEGMGLVTTSDAGWHTTTQFLHLGKDSSAIRNFHLQWRQRVCQDFLKSTQPKGTHYSGVLTFAESAELEVRDILLTALDRVMKVIEPSPSEMACGLNVDFFPLRMADR